MDDIDKRVDDLFNVKHVNSNRGSGKTYIILFITFLVVISILSVALVRYSGDISLLKNNLESTNILLDEADSELNNSYHAIYVLTGVRDDLIDSLNETMDYLNDTRMMLQAANTRIDDLQAEIASARKGDSYHLHDPTYEEMTLFLAADPVNNNTYNSSFYLCRHFAKDLHNDATKVGLRCAYVEFYGSQPPNNITEDQELWRGHAMVAFDTPDLGLIYIEPQNDQEIDIDLGKTYMDIYIQDLLVMW